MRKQIQQNESMFRLPKQNIRNAYLALMEWQYPDDDEFKDLKRITGPNYLMPDINALKATALERDFSQELQQFLQYYGFDTDISPEGDLINARPNSQRPTVLLSKEEE